MGCRAARFLNFSFKGRVFTNKFSNPVSPVVKIFSHLTVKKSCQKTEYPSKENIERQHGSVVELDAIKVINVPMFVVESEFDNFSTII